MVLFLRALVALLAALAVLVITPCARADLELGVVGGSVTYASTWRGDYGAGATLRPSIRFARVVAADLQIWESYASVNERLNTGLSLGVTGYLPFRVAHPYVRLFAIHQHEEGLVSVANAPAGTLFGIGAGIRHRAGGGLTLGGEFPLPTRAGDPRVVWNLIAEATGMYLPNALGPAGYAGVTLGVGFDYFAR